MIDFFIVIFLLCLLPVGFHIYGKGINKSDVKEWINVAARFNDIGPELSDAIKKGDVETDLQDKVIGKVLEVISIKVPEVLALQNASTSGKIYATGNYQPMGRDVTVSMDLLCRNKSRIFHYKDSPVKIGAPIIFSTEKYDLRGEIIGFDNKQ